MKKKKPNAGKAKVNQKKTSTLTPTQSSLLADFSYQSIVSGDIPSYSITATSMKTKKSDVQTNKVAEESTVENKPVQESDDIEQLTTFQFNAINDESFKNTFELKDDGDEEEMFSVSNKSNGIAITKGEFSQLINQGIVNLRGIIGIGSIPKATHHHATSLYFGGKRAFSLRSFNNDKLVGCIQIDVTFIKIDEHKNLESFFEHTSTGISAIGDTSFHKLLTEAEVSSLFAAVNMITGVDLTSDTYIQFAKRLFVALQVMNVLFPYDVPSTRDLLFDYSDKHLVKLKRLAAHCSPYGSPSPISNTVFDEMLADMNLTLEASDSFLLNSSEKVFVAPGLIGVLGYGASGKSTLVNMPFIKDVKDEAYNPFVITMGEPGNKKTPMTVITLADSINFFISSMSSKSFGVIDSTRLLMLLGTLGVGQGGISKEITTLFTFLDQLSTQLAVPIVVLINPMEEKSEVIDVLFNAIKSVAACTIKTKAISVIEDNFDFTLDVSSRMQHVFGNGTRRTQNIVLNYVNKKDIKITESDVESDDESLTLSV